MRFAWIGLGVAIGLMLLARVEGATGGDMRHGATYCWLFVGSMGIQPSELVKVMMILVLAKIFQDGEAARYEPRVLLIRLAMIAVPIGLIAVQPDLGAATLVTLIVLSTGFLAMPSVWPPVYVTLAGLLAIPVLWESMHEYGRDCQPSSRRTLTRSQACRSAVEPSARTPRAYLFSSSHC